MLKQLLQLSWHSAVYGIGSVISQVVGFLLIPVYTRHLSPAEYGYLEIFQVTLTILSVLFVMGLTTALFKSFFSYDDQEKKRTVVGTSFLFITLTSVLFTLLLLFLAGRFSTLVFGDTTYTTHFRLIFLTLFFDTGVLMALSVFRAREQPGRFAFFTVLRLILLLLLNIIFLMALQRGILGVLESALIAAATVYVLTVIPVVAKAGIRFSSHELRVMLAFGLPLIVSGLGAWLLMLSDRYFLQFLSTARELGLYSLGYRFGMVIQVLLNAPFQNAWLPFLFSVAKEANARQVFSRVLTYFVLVAMLLALAVSALAKEVLAVMATPEYQGAYSVIAPIAFSYVAFGTYTILCIGLYLESKTRLLAVIVAAAALLKVLLNLLLIPDYGMMGAAVATFVSFLILPVAGYFSSRRYYAIRYEWGRILCICLATALIFGATMLIDRTYAWLGSYWFVGALKLLAVACYPAVLYALGFFSPEEKQKISSTVRAAARHTRRCLPG